MPEAGQLKTGDIMLKKVDIEAGSATKVIKSLDMSCFDRNDYLNLLLQRSEVMFDIPKSGRIIKA